MHVLSLFFTLIFFFFERDKAIHNTLEKNRRAHLKECFENLQNELPQYRDKKVTNLSILNYTLKYIQVRVMNYENSYFGFCFLKLFFLYLKQLGKREKEYEHEKLRLEKRKQRLNGNLSQLINDLKKDGIDYKLFLTDVNVEDETSTSTASGKCRDLFV